MCSEESIAICHARLARKSRRKPLLLGFRSAGPSIVLAENYSVNGPLLKILQNRGRTSPVAEPKKVGGWCALVGVAQRRRNLEARSETHNPPGRPHISLTISTGLFSATKGGFLVHDLTDLRVWDIGTCSSRHGSFTA